MVEWIMPTGDAPYFGFAISTSLPIPHLGVNFLNQDIPFGIGIMFEFGLVPISPLTLRSDAPLGADVFSWHAGDEHPILLVASDCTVPVDTLHKIHASPDLKLYIPKDDISQYQKYLRSHIAEWTKDESLPSQFRAAAMAEVVRDVLSIEFSRNDSFKLVNTTNRLGTHMAELVSNIKLSGMELTSILHHDYTTFTHSANVGFYCALLATNMGFSEQDVAEIAAGGLVHDLGKLEIDERILNKPSKLDEFEFRAIKAHPLVGFRRLTASPEVTTRQLLMTYQHHERLDGKGYPVGIAGDEIDVVSRICSVADVFEALTSHRPYRTALSHSRALAIMQAEVDTAFDKEIFQCWFNTVRDRLPS